MNRVSSPVNIDIFNKAVKSRCETDNINPMFKEINRLNSFRNWPCTYLQPKQLARAGFYSINRDDIVRCPFCHVEIGKWEEGDDPVTDHRKWSRGCPFIENRPCGNIPIEKDHRSMSAGQDTCGKYGIEVRPNSFPEREGNPNPNNNLNLSKLGVQPNRGPSYPAYVSLESRIKSFEEWPRSIKQKPDELAAAGFFYNGKGDQTLCFHCGGGLKDWEEEDDPWEQHAKWFSKCTFVVLQKGTNYISQICGKDEAILASEDAASIQAPSSSSLNISPVTSARNPVPKTSTKTKSKKDETQTKELVSSTCKPTETNTLCKICFSKEVGVVFLPCGHIVACVDCAPALNTCAVCRKPLEATVRAFLS